MKEFICKNCGSNDFIEKTGYRICNHCGTKYIITPEDKRVMESTIELNSDVAMLLEKCKEDPERAAKYAQRILEIDPNNEEASRIFAEKYKKNYKSSQGGCYVATAVYGSYDCPQVWTLRRFRDNTLASSWYGRLFIRLYYAVSPTIVKWFGSAEWFNNMWKPVLDRMVRNLNDAGVKDTPYDDKKW